MDHVHLANTIIVRVVGGVRRTLDKKDVSSGGSGYCHMVFNWLAVAFWGPITGRVGDSHTQHFKHNVYSVSVALELSEG